MNIKLIKPLICKLSGSVQNHRLIGRFSSTRGKKHCADSAKFERHNI